jgi:bacillolysin
LATVVLSYDDIWSESTVGVGTGVWGDRKKLSVDKVPGGYRADDKLRPPALLTFDLRFDLRAAIAFSDTGEISSGFVAQDADNDWGDGGVVDAHVYAGQTYDYYYKRHGRRGIDDRDLMVRSITHFVPPSYNLANAYWDPFTRSMFYYEGDADYGVFSGAQDVVAHELTHGVTQYSWGSIYAGESGALNEAFSDIMGTSVEFYFEPPGNQRHHADYWIGEDVARIFDPRRFAFRSMDNPAQFCSAGVACHPDHYTRRYLGREDNGGVHVNAAIANQAFYLLIEGGTNRTSGVRVAGIGAANRERAERIFYRGFVRFLVPSATFTDARAATVQAARELYGSSSNEAAQTAAAWAAVGVN